MREAFDFTLDQYIFFEGYSGAAPLVRDEAKSGRQRGNVQGPGPFRAAFPQARPLVVGTGGPDLPHWSTHGA